MKTKADKERAKDVILAIVEAAGGTLDNKTNLFKAFYHAHLVYARDNQGYLSTWPIVRMPNGPGVEDFDRLIGELIAESALELKEVSKGTCTAFRFKLNPHTSRVVDLPSGAPEAIRSGYAMVRGKRASQVSDESHKLAWKSARNGHEMNIYLDLYEEDEFAKKQAESESLGKLFKEAWSS